MRRSDRDAITLKTSSSAHELETLYTLKTLHLDMHSFLHTRIGKNVNTPDAICATPNSIDQRNPFL